MSLRSVIAGLLASVAVAALPVTELPAAQYDRVYICTDDAGHQSIQDAPCKAAQRSRSLLVEDRPDRPDGADSQAAASAGSRQRPSRSTPPSRAPNRSWSSRDVSRCRSYQQGKMQLQARMRAGYSASEASRLEAGMRKLNGLIDEHCRGVPQRYWVNGNASERPPSG